MLLKCHMHMDSGLQTCGYKTTYTWIRIYVHMDTGRIYMDTLKTIFLLIACLYLLLKNQNQNPEGRVSGSWRSDFAGIGPLWIWVCEIWYFAESGIWYFVRISSDVPQIQIPGGLDHLRIRSCRTYQTPGDKFWFFWNFSENSIVSLKIHNLGW